MNEAQGTPANQPQYRVVRGCIRKPRGGDKRQFVGRNDFFQQGDLLPAGVFGSDDIESWLADGRIARVNVEPAVAAQAGAAIEARGKWTVDPATLVGKGMDALLLMVAEIDPEFDTDQLASEADAVRLLTSNWNPVFAQVVPPANDRSKPEVINLSHLEQTEDGSATRSTMRPLSEAGQDALARARAKAQAPTEAPVSQE